MKIFHLLSIALLIMLAASPGWAQRPGTQTPSKPATQPASTPAPQVASNAAPMPVSKMAVIFSDAFMDPKAGIFKFASLITKLNGEFQKISDDLKGMQQRAQLLQDEISKLQAAPIGTPIDQRSITAKVDQLDQLKKDIQRKGEDAQTSYDKRRQEIFAPLNEEIGKALEVFAKARNINLIIDGAQVPIIYAAQSTDITRAFINDFNSKNPVTASTTPPQ